LPAAIRHWLSTIEIARPELAIRLVISHVE
jgi:hypothetical protein